VDGHETQPALPWLSERSNRSARHSLSGVLLGFQVRHMLLVDRLEVLASKTRNPGVWDGADPDVAGRFAPVELLQTDAAVNQGNSGGPMFNMFGEALGIASHIVSKSGVFEGLGFVAVSSVARELLLGHASVRGSASRCEARAKKDRNESCRWRDPQFRSRDRHVADGRFGTRAVPDRAGPGEGRAQECAGGAQEEPRDSQGAARCPGAQPEPGCAGSS